METPDGETGRETPERYASRKEHGRCAVARRRRTRASAGRDATVGDLYMLITGPWWHTMEAQIL